MSRTSEQTVPVSEKTAEVKMETEETISYAWWPTSRGRRALVVTGLIAIAAVVALESWLYQSAKPLVAGDFLKLEFSFDSTSYSSIANQWRAAGLAGFDRQFLPDMFLPVAYGVALFCLISIVLTPKPWGMSHLPTWRRSQGLARFRKMREARWLRVLPVIAGVADLAENGSEWAILRGGMENVQVLPLVAGIVSVVKWVFLGLSLIVTLWSLLVQVLVKRGLLPLRN